jgi:hypothetical protein
MKFISALLLTILLAYTAFLYSDIIPWWGVALGAFLVGLLVPQKAWKGWLSGFLGVFICWAVLAWYIDNANASLLSAKMGQVIPLGGSPVAIIAVTGVIGALVGGFASLSGSLLRKKPATISQ